MRNHLYKVSLTKDSIGNESQKLSYLKKYLILDKDLDEDINQKFPISYFGNENETLKIKGAKGLIDAFDEIDSGKFDFNETLKNIRFIGINDEGEIGIEFPNENINAYGIYDFTSDLLDPFHLTKYVRYCINKEYTDIIKFNIDEQLNRDKEKEKQFRLLRDKNDELRIRGITSTLYKNYDNNIVLYLSLLALHKYAKKEDIFYYVDRANISDSSLYIFFEQEKSIKIPKIGDIYFGLAVSNGEIRNKTFKAEVRYKIVNPKNKTSFSAIFTTPVFSIVHNMSLPKIESNLENLFKLDEHEKSVINFIEKLQNIEILTEDSIYFLISDLLEKISDCSDISKKTRDEFKKEEVDIMLRGTLTLVEFFGKLNTIVTDMDEKIFIERIFHKVIADLLNRKRD
ncbi:hypothetical protein ACR77J_16705 [Tissierella praeacuta]|uniref:hypothetical protein n=1 Tax=Tissierella praeacuta TaxID=43131 RepID=UPI003DA38B90